MVEDTKTRNGLGCGDHKMVEFRILRERRRAKPRTTVLHCRRDVNFFRHLLGRIPRDTALKRRGSRIAG